MLYLTFWTFYSNIWYNQDEVVLVEENMDVMVTELPELEIQITSEWRRGYLCPLSQASRSKGHKELFLANNITGKTKNLWIQNDVVSMGRGVQYSFHL